MTAGEILRALRLRRQQTQVEFARSIGVHGSAVSLWERGRLAVPSVVFAMVGYTGKEPLSAPPRRYFPIACANHARGLDMRRRVALCAHLSAHEAAAYLRVTTMTIWRHRRAIKDARDRAKWSARAVREVSP